MKKRGSTHKNHLVRVLMTQRLLSRRKGLDAAMVNRIMYQKYGFDVSVRTTYVDLEAIKEARKTWR